MAKNKTLKPRPYNSGTMTEAAFWGMLRSHLRRLTLRWKPRSECLKDNRRPSQGSNKRKRWEYECYMCGGWFYRDEVEVDHIVEAGSLKSFDDAGPFIQRLLPEKEGWGVVCKPCHQVKTQQNRKKKEEVMSNV